MATYQTENCSSYRLNGTVYNSSLTTSDDNTSLVVTNGNDYWNYKYVNTGSSLAMLMVNQVYSIDAKIDDGIPSSGIVLGISLENSGQGPGGPTGFGCVDDDVDFDYFEAQGGTDLTQAVAHYQMNDTDQDCSLMYIFR